MVHYFPTSHLMILTVVEYNVIWCTFVYVICYVSYSGNILLLSFILHFFGTGLENQCKGNSSPFLMSLVVDEERMNLGQCFSSGTSRGREPKVTWKLDIKTESAG